jgi:hypothetical protein
MGNIAIIPLHYISKMFQAMNFRRAITTMNIVPVFLEKYGMKPCSNSLQVEIEDRYSLSLKAIKTIKID